MFDLTPYDKWQRGIEKSMRDMFNPSKFFESFFNDSFSPATYMNMNQMKVDVKENEKEYIVEAELPGASKDDINIELNNDRLTISVERNEETKDERQNYIRRERKYGSMSRSFYVDNVDAEKVTAGFENGLLSISLPKKEEGKGRSNRIQIN